MRKEVMMKAVKMAKKMKGHWIARMSLALRTAWTIVKKRVTKTFKRPIELVKERLEHFYNDLEFNIWEKYGKSRIYVNGIQHGYFDFDQDGNIEKWYFDCGYDFKMQNELTASAKLMQMGEFL